MITVKLIKNITAISAGFMILGVGANAQDLKFYESVMQNGEYSFVVEGYTTSKAKDEELNVMVFNPGYALEDDKDIYGGEYLQYQTIVTTKDGGYFKAEMPIYLDGVNDSGEYTCYVGGEAFSGSKSATVYFASIADREDAVTRIKNSSLLDMKTALSEAERDLALVNDIYNVVDKEKLAELVFENKALLDSEKPADSAKVIRSLALLEAYNEGLTQFAVSGTEFINKELIDFATVDKDGATFYKAYSEILSTEGKSKLISSLIKNGYKTVDELYKDFMLKVVIEGIKYPATNGTGHIDELLTDKNVKALGLSIPTYAAITSDSIRTKANTAIKKASFSDKESLEKAIEDAAKDAKKTKPAGGGSGGGGSSSGNNNSMNIVIGDNKVDLNQNIVDNEALKGEVFADLGDVEWAKDAILALFEKGIVSGVGDNLYAPQNNVTREQFIVMIMRALKIDATESNTVFSDVQAGSYYEKYVATAKKLGIVNGISEDSFGVGKNITRQDLAVMVLNAAKYMNKSLEGDKNIVFSDNENIADYAKEAVENLVKTGAISGFPDNTFRPEDNCTRAQAAKIIYEIVKGADE